MTTRETIDRYFDSLGHKQGWETYLAEDLVFTNFMTPPRQVAGRSAYLQATQRFYGMITSLDVRSVIVDGDRACVLTRYDLQPPAGPAFQSDVAEIFHVRDGKIASFEIYFDSAPYPKPPAPAN